MDTVKNLLGPLASGTGPIQDTVVSSYVYFEKAASIAFSIFRERFTECFFLFLLLGLIAMGGDRWYCWDCATDVQVGLEWLCWLWVPSSISPRRVTVSANSNTTNWPRLSPLSPAFFLTAHFSQEDYPYDWYVPDFLIWDSHFVFRSFIFTYYLLCSNGFSGPSLLDFITRHR